MKAQTKKWLIMGAPLAALILVCVGLQQCEFHSSPPQTSTETEAPLWEGPPGSEPEEVPEPMVPRPQGEWVEAGRIQYRVICSSYGTTDYDDNPDVLQVNLLVQSLANDVLTLEDDSFALQDADERTFRQVTTYGGSHHFATLQYEKLNPGTVKQYSLYFDVPGKTDYTLHAVGEDTEYGIISPQKDCLAELIQSYDLSGIHSQSTSDE